MKRITGHFESVSKGSEAMAARTTGAFKTVGIGAAAMVAGILGLVAINKVAGYAGKFDMQLQQVGAISKATAEDLRLLERAAIEAGIATQFSPMETVEGLKTLAQAGLNAKDSITALVPALDLAAGGQISIADSAAVMVAAVKSYQVPIEDVTLATDQLLRITQMTQISGNELRQGLANMARGALSASKDLSSMLPVLGLVRDTGLDISVAGTAVSSAIDFMSRKSDEFNDIAGKQVRLTDKQTGKFRDFQDIVLDVGKALEGYKDQAERSAKITELFGRFGKTAFLAVDISLRRGIKDNLGTVRKGADAIQYLKDQMASAGGTAKMFRERMLDTLEGQKILLKGALQTLTVVIGKPLAAVLKPMVGFLFEMVGAFTKWFDNLNPRIKQIFAGLLVGAAVVLTFVGALIAAKGILVLLASVGITALAPFLLILAKIALIAAVVVGVAYLIKKAWETNFGGIRDYILPIIKKIQLAFEALIGIFTKGGFSKAVSDELNKAENRGVKAFVVGVVKLWHRLGVAVDAFLEAISGLWDELSTMFKPIIDELAGALGELWESLKDIGEQLGLVDGTVNATEDSWGNFGSRLGQVAKAVVKTVAWMVGLVVKYITLWVKIYTWVADKIAGAIQFWSEVDWAGIWDAVVGFFSDVGAAVVKVWDAIVAGIKAAINAVVNFLRVSLADMMQSVVWLLDKIPEALRPAFLTDWITGTKLAMDELRKPVNLFGAEPATTGTAVVSAPAYTPRKRATVLPAEAVGAAAARGTELPAGTEGSLEALNTQVQVFLDGEQVGEALDKRKRDTSARRGQVVPVFAGGTR